MDANDLRRHTPRGYTGTKIDRSSYTLDLADAALLEGIAEDYFGHNAGVLRDIAAAIRNDLANKN